MVTTKPTQSPRGSSSESGHVTAEAGQILREHYRVESIRQHAAFLEARSNRDALTLRYRNNPEAVRPYQIDDANRQLNAARAVDQYVRSVAVVYGNREF